MKTQHITQIGLKDLSELQEILIQELMIHIMKEN